ncbi:MAG: CopG family transcriptional regulator [Bacteroidales bacterium]|nr:CopG family transcriptional regulator [Bacteroidales bacterium]
MEKRIGTAIIYIENREAAPKLNEVLSRHAEIIICRQGFPRNTHSIISVIFEGTTDQIGSLTGQLGRIDGIEVKSVLLKQKDNSNEQ